MAERQLARIPDDFEATIRILSIDEGGRTAPTFNGICWNFQYADDPADSLWMIFPDFFDGDEHSLPADLPLGVGVELPARMVILDHNLRSKVHQKRLQAGTRFLCKEGTRSVAHGRVTKTSGLFSYRAK